MNEQIRKLALEAGYVPIPNAEFANSLNEAFHQKFAELIIKEVFEVANNNFYSDPHDLDIFLEDIKQHFGVKS